MTPEQAAHVLEPLWIAVEASMERLQEMLEAVEGGASDDAYRDAIEIHHAEAWLMELSRRIDAERIDSTVWTTPSGRGAFWPRLVAQRDQAAAIDRWLEKNPKIAKARRERKAAYIRRLDDTTNRV